MKKLNLMIAIIATLFLSCNQDTELYQVDKNTTTVLNEEMHMCTEIPSLMNSNATAKPNATILNSLKWASGQTIRVKFLNGDDFLKEKVKLYAKFWTYQANINFQYVSANENADVKVAFKWNNDVGSWSHLGTNCKSIDQNTPSINFGWFDSNTTDTEFKRVILHEFGHIMGLIHEHQSPVGNILWDKPKVYEYYQRTQGWTTQQVDNNIFTKYSTTITNYSAYDNLSIMHYFIDPSLTLNGYGVGTNLALSFQDKYFINLCYPRPTHSILTTGRVYTVAWDVRSPNGRYTLICPDGEMYINDLENNETRIWRVGSSTYKNAYCELQPDGDLIIKGRSSTFGQLRILWNSGTSGNPGAELHLQDDGNLVLFYNGIAKWSSKTGKL